MDLIQATYLSDTHEKPKTTAGTNFTLDGWTLISISVEFGGMGMFSLNNVRLDVVPDSVEWIPI